jgi:uncharacterized membrane protein YccC
MVNVAGVTFDERPTPLHAVRTTMAAVVSLLVARALRMPEPYWATVTTIVVMQSTLGAAWKVSAQRFAGTVLGALAGGWLASRFGSSVWAYGAAVFGLGLLCIALRLDRAAYRFAGITVAIVALVSRPEAAWRIAIHRFVEVSLGIVVALILTAVWPEKHDDSSPSK